MFKQDFINRIFDDVSSKYDVMNDVMSAGIHRLWKNRFVSLVGEVESRIMDLACGTGDITVRICDKAKSLGLSTDICAVDVSEKMIEKTRARLIDQNILSGVNLCVSSATKLDFEDNSFDYVLISYGIRNVENIEEALRECHRILKPNGKFLCLEFSKVTPRCAAKMYDLYSDIIIPKMGALIAKNKDAYEYLVESIKHFKDPLTFMHMIKQAGFSKCNFERLTFGVCCIHIGIK